MWECCFSGQFLSVGKHLPSVSQNQYSEEWGLKVPAFIADLSLAIKNSYNFPKYRNSCTFSSASSFYLCISIYFVFYFDEFSVCSSPLTSHFVCAVMRTGLWLLRCCRTLVLCCDLQPVLWFWTAPDSVYSITTKDSYLLKHQQFL